MVNLGGGCVGIVEIFDGNGTFFAARLTRVSKHCTMYTLRFCCTAFLAAPRYYTTARHDSKLSAAAD